MKLAIIVPYRDRRDDLDVFIPHMEKFLANKQIDYKIFVAEQSDDRAFNYGKICNAVFNEIKDDYDYFCFHDVDLLPLNDDADYSYKDTPTHLVFENENKEKILPYSQYFGGVVIFSKDDFIKVNGFGNDYWGKGYVDLDLLHRCLKSKITLTKNYDYEVKEMLKSDLKYRNITKKVSKIVLPENSIIVNRNSNVIATDFTLSFHYKEVRQNRNKIVIFRTLDVDDFQIFTINGQMILQFFDKGELFQIDINNEVDITQFNHFTFTHHYNKKEFIIYINGVEKFNINYTINYNFTKKNVILGDIDNSVKIELIDFKLFTKKLTKNEVNRNFYYGVKSNCFEFNKLTFYDNLTTFIDEHLNIWEIMGKTTSDKENLIIGEMSIVDVLNKQLNKVKYTPNKIKGRYEIRGNKFADIEKTYHPDIIENKKTYYDDLLANKINISKFGLKSVKYTLLNKIEHNNNTEWLKISL
jgi:hypothetical protein